jgi:hypothetical protein
MSTRFDWARRHTPGYEVSSVGDKRFSAFSALMPDGRSIEHWYQCDVKGFEPGGTNWRLGKGKPPIYGWSEQAIWDMYVSLWRVWALKHLSEMLDLKEAAEQNGHMLTDCFASTPINQARALAQILNEWSSS